MKNTNHDINWSARDGHFRDVSGCTDGETQVTQPITRGGEKVSQHAQPIPKTVEDKHLHPCVSLEGLFTGGGNRFHLAVVRVRVRVSVYV